MGSHGTHGTGRVNADKATADSIKTDIIRTDSKQKGREGGWLLAELLIATPILIMLLLVLSTTFLTLLRSYTHLLATSELVSEAEDVMGRIVLDSAQATAIEVIDEHSIKISYLYAGERERSVIYRLFPRDGTTAQTVKKRAWGYSSFQPLMAGEHRFHRMEVYAFHCTEEGDGIRVELGVREGRTGATYELETVLPKRRR